MITRPVVFLLALVCAVGVNGQSPNRTIAVTIDDLPVISTRHDAETRRSITTDLLAHLTTAKVPAVGFVNENKLYRGDKLDQQQVNLLKMWLDAGMELGNHSYSHRSLNAISIEDYKADVLRGEAITRELLKAKRGELRYFRHPYLQTGRSLEVKKGFDAFLKSNNYVIAPVSIDNSDWIFARAYDNAYDKNDPKLLKQVGDAYVPYLEAKIGYWERQSQKLFGREIAQTLLLHANRINSKYFGDIAEMLRKRGYKFVTLETALGDKAYSLPDTYVGPAGISWLHRWARDRGSEFVLPDEPKTPEFVLKAAGVESE